MENLPTDPIQKYVYDQLDPHRRDMSPSAFNAMTGQYRTQQVFSRLTLTKYIGNITFLVKHRAGPNIPPRAVVVSVISFDERI